MTWIISTDFSPTALAAFFRSSSARTGITNTWQVLEAPRVTRVLNTAAGSCPSSRATEAPSTASPSWWG